MPGIIDAEYLLSGQWHRDKQAQLAKKEKEKAMRKKLELLKWEGFPDESGYVARFKISENVLLYFLKVGNFLKECLY